jgi:hypothetical protein
VSSNVEPRPCQNVISTGDVTESRASTGHGGNESNGVVVVVAIVGGVVTVVGGNVSPGAAVGGGPASVVVVVAAGGRSSLPACRIDSPEPHAARTVQPATAHTAARRLIP